MSVDVVTMLREELKACIKMMELLQLGRQRGGTLDKQIAKAKHCLEIAGGQGDLNSQSQLEGFKKPLGSNGQVSTNQLLIRFPYERGDE